MLWGKVKEPERHPELMNTNASLVWQELILRWDSEITMTTPSLRTDNEPQDREALKLSRWMAAAWTKSFCSLQ